jgi:16S rRNA (cytosine967-C5)-methyltransferase
VDLDLLRIAATVVTRAGEGVPADRALREELTKHRQLWPGSAREISRAVFAYYRWWKWLPNYSVLQQLEQAIEFQERYSFNPAGLAETELATKAVPEWVREEVVAPGEWLRALQAEPRLWLRAKRGEAEGLIRELARLDRPIPELPELLLYTGEEDLFRTPQFHAGRFEIQDISSQLTSLVCSPKPGETWWDACAGEGGKLLHLSDLMENKGLIWATDRAAWRLQNLKRRAARAGVFNYRSALWNGGPKLPTKTKFDGVLLDAPCSGLGTWHRNPHARWTTTLRDVNELSVLQTELLTRAAGAVKPGGKLFYAVCTLTKSETTSVAEAFERSCPQFKPLLLANPARPQAPPAAPLWLWPQDLGGNGMFIAAWQKDPEDRPSLT